LRVGDLRRTGDLTKRLVVPALYNLLRTKVLPENFALTAWPARRHRGELVRSSQGHAE